MVTNVTVLRLDLTLRHAQGGERALSSWSS